MDHKQQLARLDPKLREAYDKVMGINLPPITPPQPVQTLQSPTAATNPPLPPTTPFVTPSTRGTPLPATQHSALTSTQQTTQTPLRRTTETVHIGGVGGYQLQQKKVQNAGKKIPMTAIIAGLVLFFLVYTIVWVKVLNIKIPLFASLGF